MVSYLLSLPFMNLKIIFLNSPLLPAMKASLNVLVFSRFNDPSRRLNPLLKLCGACGGLGGSGLPNPALSLLGNDPKF